MADKPTTAAGYKSEQVELVRAACLYVATKLGDIMDELVVIGGLLSSLLIKQDELPEGTAAHVGTMDLDVGLTLALLDEGRYKTLTERLRRAGFEQDVNDEGKPTRQRWKIERLEKVTVDFLVQPSLPTDKGGKLRDIEHDFAAVIAPGLHLAFQDLGSFETGRAPSSSSNPRQSFDGTARAPSSTGDGSRRNQADRRSTAKSLRSFTACPARIQPGERREFSPSSNFLAALQGADG